MKLTCLTKITSRKDCGELQGLYEMIEYWTILEKASAIGPSVCTFVDLNWTKVLWELQSSITLFLNMADNYSGERLEAACTRALFYGDNSLEMIKTILEQNFDLFPLDYGTDIFGQKDGVLF
jgi:hypothetical protein